MRHLPGQEIVPGYTLDQPLGSGMTGQAWSAIASGGVRVAIKVVSDLTVLGGQREFQALTTIRDARHPNLCPIFGFWLLDESGQAIKSEFPTSSDRSSVQTSDSEPSSITVDASLLETMPVPNAGTESAQSEADVRMSDIFQQSNALVVAMGLGEMNLWDYLQQQKQIGPGPGIAHDELIRFMSAAADAIDHLNGKHAIYHCDIKPQNLLLVGGQVQVCDFGLARRVETDSRTTQNAFGTPAYGAPEMLFHRKYSPTIDQYSLAISYYELRTGRLPYKKLTPADILVSKTKGQLDFADVPPDVVAALRKATSIDPAKRFKSCRDFVRALETPPQTGAAANSRSTQTLSVTLVAAIAIIVTSVVLALDPFASRDLPHATLSPELPDVPPATPVVPKTTDVEPNDSADSQSTDTGAAA
ncbi:MAG: protein kinase, partial [Planctomycetota bacterium]